MYGKIFPQIFDSTLMADGGSDAVYLMMSLIVLKDQDGAVNIDRRILANRLDLPLDRFDAAMRVLMAPDPDSNLPDFDGRRVIHLSDVAHLDDNRGYYVVNHEHYREKGQLDDKRRKDAERQKRKRDRDAMSRKKRDASRPCHAPSEKVAHTDTDTDTKYKKEGANASRATRWTADSEIPDDWKQWAVSQGFPSSIVAAQCEEFADYWIAKAGAAGAKKDWSATWRNWWRKEWMQKHKANGHDEEGWT